MKTKVLAFILFLFIQYNVLGQAAASINYETQTGTLGTTYDWIDCSGGTSIFESGDDARQSVNWPFNFEYYDNNYTTSDSFSVATNGFIRLDGNASTSYTAASSYNLTSTATSFGQIIAVALHDGNTNDNGSWIRYLVTGSTPNRILTIEYNNLEIDWNDNRYADMQVSFYESTNRIVLKLGPNDNITKSGVDMGLHSGVNGFYHKWQEVLSGTNNTWIEYTPPNIEVSDSEGTPIAFFSTLKDAFDKINDGTFRGDIAVKINNSTSEYASPILNASSSGNPYTSVNMYPTKSGLSITGNLSGPFINLNGADNVTIDGRVNATGATKDLNIVNLSTSSASNTSTIRFINGATNNTVHYCILKGSETRSSSAILLFQTSNSSSGNSDNLIDNNDITSSTAVNRPENVIYSVGTNGKANSSNTISNNNIYDFFRTSSTSYGIYLNRNSQDWIIDGNSFYETTSFVASRTNTYNVIRVRNASINGIEIKNNFIGGSAPLCGGNAWNKANATNNAFNAIYISAGTTTPTSIQNNTIKNFDWKNSGNAEWSGIRVLAGNVNIGNILGNTIGEITGTGSIKVTGGTRTQSVYGIRIANTGIVNCSNNNIGSISGIALSTNSTNLYGIYLSGDFIGEILNNNIGSELTGSSINASSVNTTRAQSVYGIYSNNKGTTNLHENSISNLYNTASISNTGLRGIVIGMYIIEGANSINNNIVKNLSVSSAYTSASLPSVSGIYLKTKSDSQIIEKNTIYNISNEYASFTGSVVGLYYQSSTGASSSSVNSTFIHSLAVNSSSSGAKVYGIYENTDNVVFSNNIITFGENSDSQVVGIYDVGNTGKTVDFFFNSIYISGTNLGASNSYAFRYNTSANTRDLRNNILFNNRTGGTGKHFAIYYDNVGGTFTADYNDYFVNGTGGVLGYFGGDQSSLALLQAATLQDANSLNIDPLFSAAGGTTYLDYIAIGNLPGVTIPSILTDYENITRGDPPKMGALESALGFVWQGNTSTDFAIASNWLNGEVPPNGSEISFAATPANDCLLDSDRTLKSITNISAKKFVLNGKQLTLTESILSATSNQIDATSVSSTIAFEGSVPQNIPNGVFVSNTIDGLILNNNQGLIQNGDIIIGTSLALTLGVYTIGANTLTINGIISTTTGSLLGGSTSNIVVEGNGASTTLPSVTVNNFTLNRLNGISLGGDINIEGTLALTSGTLVVASNSLTITNNAPTRTNGYIDASDLLATVNFTNPVGITLPTSLFLGGINNLSISGGGITVVETITINGILNLQTANPSATKGLLDMTLPNELIMGGNATNDGGGDVTGIITRNTILDNHTYTFGNKNTYLSFYSGATSLPDYMKLKVVIGNDLWGTGTVKRVYELIQANGNNYLATFRAFYLDSELNGNAEDKLSFWAASAPFNAPVDVARSNSNFIENWVEISDFDLDFLPSTFGTFQISLDESNLTYQTWTGRIDDNWNDGRNWAEAPFSVPIPTPNSFVVIPDATTTLNDPTLPPNATTGLMTMSLKSGSILNSGASDNAQLSLSHNIGTWSNSGGTFNPGNSTVNFIYGGNTTISGTTTFHDIYIADSTAVNLTSSSYVKVSGGITISEAGSNSGEFRTRETGSTTVEYNGTNQTVINLTVLSGNNGYYKLVLSGTGIKTMPITAMTIEDEFVLEGALTATAQSVLTIGNKLEIVGGATFETGAFDHYVGGHFDVGGHLDSGTFIPTAGTTIFLNGTAVQNIYGDTTINFEKLAINNGNGADMFIGVTINDELILTNGNLNVGENTLTIDGTITKSAGFLNPSDLSELTFGGTTSLTLPSNLFPTTPSIRILTINRTGGVISNSDIGVNGILDLQSANPLATIGSFDTGNFILHMGDTATTVGVGDVTGKIKRTTILPNIEYSFGNPNTSTKFLDIGVLPTEITMKVTIGSVPSWKTDGIKRVFDIIQVGASNTRAIFKMHYLDTELNGLTENILGIFSYIIPSTTLIDRGLTEINTTDNWITLSNADFGEVSSNFGVVEHSLGTSVADILTWDGSESIDWYDAFNWTPAFEPDATKTIIIPDDTTTPNDPLVTASTTTTIKKINIKAGGVLNAGNSSEITVVGTSGAWVNNGILNANTSKVIFNSGEITEAASIAGSTNFYNLEVGPNTILQPLSGVIIRIAGAGTVDPGGTSVIDFSSVDNTVEWNGTNQDIVNPNGIGGNGGYFNLILSGIGTKTMPSSVLNIAGNFSTSGSVTAIAVDSIKVNNNITIGVGSSFATGNFHHELAGNFENNGTFIGTAGGTLIFTGEEPQTIFGTSTTSFDNLTVDKAIDNVTISSNVNVNNELLFHGGNLVVGDAILGINGTISNPSGAIEVSAVSNLSFGGIAALTLNDNLFSSEPSINNLAINRSGGVTLGNQNMTVNGLLDLPSGTLSLNDNILNLAGVSPTRTSGNIDVSSTNSEILFSNTSSITLPLSLFNGNVSNFSISGIGGVISNEAITLTGILNLESLNPSATIGSLSMESSSILDMGVDATTTGIGDVTGIVKREHIFADGVEYSFGNEFTSLNFLNVPGGIKPTWVKCKITIGAAPSWRSEAINRYYSFAQSGGTDRMITKLHYLDSELHGTETDESQLFYWDAYDPAFGVNNFIQFYPRSHNGFDANNNWIQLNGPAINYIATSNLLDVKQWGLSYSDVTIHTWTGNGSPSYDGDWSLPGNWNGGVPDRDDPTLIPNPSTLPADNNGDLNPYTNLLPVIVPSEVKTLEIAAGAELSATDYDITVYGDTDAWVNNGTFIPGNANVIFANGDDANIVTISGATNFYDITVNDKTQIQPSTGSIVRIENAFNLISGSILDFTTNNNTIDYNGTDQTVIIPNGGSTGYYHLSLSGNGIKTMPSTSFNIIGNLALSESAIATTASDLTIGADLNLTGTSQLNIGAAKTLTVNGTIANSVGTAGFVLKSTPAGTASLIHNTDNVPATVERYISGAAEDWHFLSSPIANQTIAGSSWVPTGTYGNGLGYDLYVWDEPTPCWVYHDNDGGVLPDDPDNPDWPAAHPLANFVPSRGYLYSVQALNPTNEFTGNLNNGNINYAVTATSTVDPLVIGFNLIGNPYPSAIDWKAASGWTRSNLLDSGGGYDMWIWNPAANNYGTFNSFSSVGTNDVTQYIASMQGFFVRAANNANIGMTNDIRLHTGANNWMKSSNTKNNINNLKVQIASNSEVGSDEVLLQFGSPSNASGALKLYSPNEEAPSVYLIYEGEELSVQYLTEADKNPRIPVMFKPGSDGNYTFSIDNTNFEYLMLEDKKMKTIHNLLENSNYQFKASVSDKSSRFVLHFAPEDKIKEEFLANIYYNGDDIILDFSLLEDTTNVKIFDMLGRLILQTNFEGKLVHQLPIGELNSVLIVVAKNKNNVIRQKVLIY